MKQGDEMLWLPVRRPEGSTPESMIREWTKACEWLHVDRGTVGIGTVLRAGRDDVNDGNAEAKQGAGRHRKIKKPRGLSLINQGETVALSGLWPNVSENQIPRVWSKCEREVHFSRPLDSQLSVPWTTI